MARTPHHVIAVVALGVAALLSACSDGDAEDATPRAHVTTTATTAPPTTASTTTKPITPEEQVKADYLEAARTLDRALLAAGDDHVALATHFSGGVLDRIEEHIAELRAKGQRSTHSLFGERIPTIDQVEIEGDRAVVSGCAVNDMVIIDDRGTVVDDSAHSIRFRSVLTRSGNRWVVIEESSVQRWEDSLGCDR